MKIHKTQARLVARKRMLKYLVLKGVPINGKEYPNIKEYCKLIGVEVPPTKKESKTFLIKEYQRELSPIFKGVKLPVWYRKKRIKKDPKEWQTKREFYENYLNSSKWITFRNKIKKERGDKCEKCGKEGVVLDGHHITYERLTEELPEDILIICRPCHEKIHGRKFHKKKKLRFTKAMPRQ